MWYINPTVDENQNYGVPHSPANPGDYELPDDLFDQYLETMGYAIITVDENNVIIDIKLNEDAYHADIDNRPPNPDPVPTQLDIIEAQTLYTALLTNTLLEV